MNRRSILLVEDNPDDEELILMSLRKNGIANEVEVVRDGQEALDRLLGGRAPSVAEGDGFPTLILLDLKLPKVDGLEVLKRLRGDPRTRLQPVVILTSSDEERDRVDSYASGANSYVCKPVDFAAFAEAVKQLGLYWLILNKPPKA